MTKRKSEMRAKRTRGRPREYDHKIIMQEMIEWSLKKTSKDIVGFCASHGYLASVLFRLSHEFEDFEEAFILTKMRLAERRARLLDDNNLNYGAYARYQKMYDPFLDQHEESDKDKDAKRKKDISKQETMNLATMLKLVNEGKIKQSDIDDDDEE